MTPVSSSTTRRSRTTKTGGSSPPSGTSAPPAQIPSRDDRKWPFHDGDSQCRFELPRPPSPKVAIYLSTGTRSRRACHLIQQCHQRTLALMVLVRDRNSAPPVAFRCLALQQIVLFGPCGAGMPRAPWPAAPTAAAAHASSSPLSSSGTWMINIPLGLPLRITRKPA